MFVYGSNPNPWILRQQADNDDECKMMAIALCSGSFEACELRVKQKIIQQNKPIGMFIRKYIVTLCICIVHVEKFDKIILCLNVFFSLKLQCVDFGTWYDSLHEISKMVLRLKWSYYFWHISPIILKSDEKKNIGKI